MEMVAITRLEIFQRDFVQTGLISESVCNWLQINGFFSVPASVSGNGSHVGGLFDHSYSVMEELEEMTEHLGLKWKRLQSPSIVGMFHDLCKIDRFTPNTDSSVADAYRYADPILRGHGEKSVMLLSQLITLTEEEIYCIRFHMGAFNTDDTPFYLRAIEKYPNVLYTHTADMAASHIRMM